MALSKKLKELVSKITNKQYIDEDEVRKLIKEVQRALLSSDVNVKLVFKLSKRIEEKTLKTEKISALSLREHFLKVVYEELVLLMGEKYTPRTNPHKILLCGLYGSGKTTTAAKLAYFYKKRGLTVGLVGADVDRPAAQEQLAQLANKVGAKYYTIKGEKNASKIVEYGIDKSKEEIIIVDSAGRTAFDKELSEELGEIYSVINPEETFLVLNADIGQVAGKQAEEFNKTVGISGVIVTKMDGSGKGGGALSAVASTNTKIAFIGVGEKLSDLEVYDPEKFVKKLLGLPDLESLMDKLREIAKENEIKEEDLSELTIEGFYKQMKAAKKLGPLGDVFSMLGASNIPKEMIAQSEEKMKKYESMINSMTKEEKRDAKLIKRNPSRITRIAVGSGCSEKEVREFLSQFDKVEKMMNRVKKDRGFRKKLEQMFGGNLKNIPNFK